MRYYFWITLSMSLCWYNSGRQHAAEQTASICYIPMYFIKRNSIHIRSNENQLIATINFHLPKLMKYSVFHFKLTSTNLYTVIQ